MGGWWKPAARDCTKWGVTSLAQHKKVRLKKELRLSDVYVIATGAMFSSGFFLLPGLATASTGPSVILAYFLSALLIVPAMLSQAELATAMPRAGGAYYFLDRTLGPLVGTIGGLGTWMALILKSAFALIGMGAYLAIVLDVPVKPLAVTLTVLFAGLNILGAKQSTRVIRVLVWGLLAILGFFILHGISTLLMEGIVETHRTQFSPFFTNGLDGLLGTVGLVFVSYVGLTQVASLAEEVENPDRNIPLGMILSLVTVTAVYVVGVYIMVAVMGPSMLSGSLTPVADAAGAFFTWIPAKAGVLLMVVAAVAAFASMSNTGILAASRYPLAMARDHLIPQLFASLGRFRTPVPATIVTAALLVFFILVLNVAQVAKLASAIQLLLFGLINISVIVMRESHIESYDPGFRSPWYPWMQIAGIVFPLILVAEMGWLASLSTMGMVAVSIGWYNYYARGRLARDGAIYHVFERLGRRRFAGLERELRDIMKEKGARAEDPFDEVVAHASLIDVAGAEPLAHIIEDASDLLARSLPASAEQIAEQITRGVDVAGMPMSHGVALLHARFSGVEFPALVLVRSRAGVTFADTGMEHTPAADDAPVHAVFVLVSGVSDPGRHLRILAHLAGRVELDDFIPQWLAAEDEQELKEILLRDDRFLSIEIKVGTPSEALIGRALKEIRMPEGSLIALIHRSGETLVPRGATVLRERDRLTVIGGPEGLSEVAGLYGG
ncbi:MAG: amino acid permease [Gemmatimonadetes bacterium]|nr:amino acid permease [Gemmatimonadota bacterium]